MPEYKKRETAHKLRIGDIIAGTPIVEDIPQDAAPNPNESIVSGAVKERFRFLEIGDKKIVRVNLVANVIEKYESGGDKKYASTTIDDATGQIRIKAFGDDISMLTSLGYGDTIIIIGVLRSYNREIYILPEIVKKADPRYLLVRKLELENNPGEKKQAEPGKALETRDLIIDIIKLNQDPSGTSTEDIILKIKTATPEVINSEVIKLIEEGMIYEPRPGRVRWLG